MYLRRSLATSKSADRSRHAGDESLRVPLPMAQLVQDAPVAPDALDDAQEVLSRRPEAAILLIAHGELPTFDQKRSRPDNHTRTRLVAYRMSSPIRVGAPTHAAIGRCSGSLDAETMMRGERGLPVARSMAQARRQVPPRCHVTGGMSLPKVLAGSQRYP